MGVPVEANFRMETVPVASPKEGAWVLGYGGLQNYAISDGGDLSSLEILGMLGGGNFGKRVVRL